MVHQTMCDDGRDHIIHPPSSSSYYSSPSVPPSMVDKNDFGQYFSPLLEMAANNDLESFKQAVSVDPSVVHDVRLWYGRIVGSKNQMGLENRTALMVAATYGSIGVLNLLLSMLSVEDVNRCFGQDKTTALHCAASGGSDSAVDAVKLLLLAGADPNCVDGSDRRPVDVIFAPPKDPRLRFLLENLLDQDGFKKYELDSRKDFAGYQSSMDFCSSLPDIKNSVYSTDEFRMFSFKVRPCSRAYSHDWTECPFAHPGENARRRDPRKFHYSCVPCPDFRKGGVCRRGDMCEFAHGVFECYLHPAQYRTRQCKEGTSCVRRVCFFAHTPEELRPLYGSSSSGSAGSPAGLMSPRAVMDMAAAMNLNINFGNGSPPPHNPVPWPQPNVPTLHLPMSASGNLQASRLRAALSARDIAVDDFGRMKSNFEDVFAAAEMSSLSPSYNTSEVQQIAMAAALSNAQKNVIANQLQQWHQQKQSMLSPIKTTNVFSPNGHPSHLQASLGTGRMSPHSNVEPLSPMGGGGGGGGSRFSALAQMEKQQQLQMRSLSSRELGSSGLSCLVGSPGNSSMAEWGSPSGKLDWAVNGEELGRLRRSNSFELKARKNSGEEQQQQQQHNVHWPQSVVTADHLDGGEESGDVNINQIDDVDVIGGWLKDAVFR